MVAPLVAWERLASGLKPEVRERAAAYALNAAVIARMRPCDVFICMSGTYLEAAIYARQRFGAQVWLERGSRHILSQNEILHKVGAAGASSFMTDRELSGYDLADRIVLPSSHARDSFLEVSSTFSEKLFVNSYGVNLTQFPVVAKVSGERPVRLLTVGTWGKQKGSDLLEELVLQRDDYTLTHVGGIGDLPFPEAERFTHIDSVPQTELTRYYADADIYVQASRQEGLAVVQVQALASGLPLACSYNSGGADLMHDHDLRERVQVFEAESIESMEKAIETLALTLPNLQPPSEASRQSLTWKAYGERYERELLKHLAS